MNELDLFVPRDVFRALLPEILLSGWALFVLMVTAWRHKTAADSRLAGVLSLVGIGVTIGVVVAMWLGGASAAGIPNMIEVDAFRFSSSLIFLVAAGFTILVSFSYVQREQLIAPEYYSLILLATVGMMFMAGAADLVVLFLGLEVMSVSVYVLTGFNRASPASAEAGVKYFLIGAFASAFLLYGIALVYGTTGNTNLTLIAAQLGSGKLPLMAALGLGLLIIGFGFKVAAVPFHMWAPDVYDGAPTPVTGFMAAAVKAAGFAALTRVLLEGFPSSIAQWQPVVGVLAVVTMIAGNLVALVQKSLKRMLAYSSVAHAGYLLTALWPGNQFAASTVMLYLVAYSLTTIASFCLLAALGKGGERDVTLDDIAGLSRRRPWMSLALAICMLSLLGFPGTVGFIGKWYILTSIVAQGQVVLAVVVVLTSVVSAGYYLPVIMAMYMRPAPETPRDESRVLLPAAAVVVGLCVIGLLLFGVWPNELISFAQASVKTLGETLLPVAVR